jgi:hypothetical protein
MTHEEADVRSAATTMRTLDLALRVADLKSAD